MKHSKHTKRFLLVGVASVVGGCGAAAKDGDQAASGEAMVAKPSDPDYGITATAANSGSDLAVGPGPESDNEPSAVVRAGLPLAPEYQGGMAGASNGAEPEAILGEFTVQTSEGDPPTSEPPDRDTPGSGPFAGDQVEPAYVEPEVFPGERVEPDYVEPELPMPSPVEAGAPLPQEAGVDAGVNQPTERDAGASAVPGLDAGAVTLASAQRRKED